MTRPVAHRIISINIPYALLRRVNAYVRDFTAGDDHGKVGRSAFFTKAAKEFLDRRESIGSTEKEVSHDPRR